jgi:multidrug efflux pump subunit AcrA (membrane-fusion protein)
MALYADFNTKVTKDQLIARLDPASLQSKVDQAQANLETARATAANAQVGFRRLRRGSRPQAPCRRSGQRSQGRGGHSGCQD